MPKPLYTYLRHSGVLLPSQPSDRIIWHLLKSLLHNPLHQYTYYYTTTLSLHMMELTLYYLEASNSSSALKSVLGQQMKRP